MRVAEVELRGRYVFCIVGVLIAPAVVAITMPGESNPAIFNLARFWYWMGIPVGVVAVLYDWGVLMFELGRKSVKRSEIHGRVRRMLYSSMALLTILAGFILTNGAQ